MLQHLGGKYTLSVQETLFGSCWIVKSDVEGVSFLLTGSAPSMCPAADPLAARIERLGQINWRCWEYLGKHGGIGRAESRGITVKCNKCIN